MDKVTPEVQFETSMMKLFCENSNTAEKIKFSISKCDQHSADLVTFTEEILEGKLHFLCSVKGF